MSQFRQDWEARGEPEIAPYVEGWSEPPRWDALRELIRIDCEYRRRQGKEPAAAHYQQQFPEHASSIEAMFLDRTVEHDSPVQSTKTQLDSTDSAGPSASAPPESVPERIGRHRVCGQLGRGSFWRRVQGLRR